MLRLSFSSNAFKKNTLPEAARAIATAGYGGLEVMADQPHAYPPAFGASQRRELRQLLASLGLQVANVNAFTLFAAGDTYHPTFLETDEAMRQRRIKHTIAALELAGDIGAPSVSIQPGGPLIGTGLSRAEAGERFAEAIGVCLPTARRVGIPLAIEPEPGLFLQTSGEYLAFKQEFFAGEAMLRMNCDLGHLFCVGDDPLAVLRTMLPEVAHIHLEDIGSNHVHQHLPLGKGGMPLEEILRAIGDSDYGGWTTVELYPYVSTAAEVAGEAMTYLREHGLA